MNLIGQKFGKLTVVEKIGSRQVGKSSRSRCMFWKCVCDCGGSSEVATASLTSGNSSSCGCGKYTGNGTRTHGMSGTRFYNIWTHMVKRSNEDKEKRPVPYQKKEFGRDPNWSVFENFYEDMYHGYEDGLTLGRIDNSKGYYKDNCRWESPALQSRNQGKPANNTSGATGIIWKENKYLNGKSTTYAVANWQENGNSCSKAFSVKKYGIMEAFALAVQYRKDQIARLNELGYGYTDTHGL